MKKCMKVLYEVMPATAQVQLTPESVSGAVGTMRLPCKIYVVGPWLR